MDFIQWIRQEQLISLMAFINRENLSETRAEGGKTIHVFGC